jgi:hypothetical protein
MLAASCASQRTSPIIAMSLFLPETCNKTSSVREGGRKRGETAHGVDSSQEKEVESDLRDTDGDHSDANAEWQFTVRVVSCDLSHLYEKKKEKVVRKPSTVLQFPPSSTRPHQARYQVDVRERPGRTIRNPS